VRPFHVREVIASGMSVVCNGHSMGVCTRRYRPRLNLRCLPLRRRHIDRSINSRPLDKNRSYSSHHPGGSRSGAIAHCMLEGIDKFDHSASGI
jgi:hypothetical protein